MQIDIDKFLKDGYSITQINQILLADNDLGEFLTTLNPNTPDKIFRDIRINHGNYTGKQYQEIRRKYSKYPDTKKIPTLEDFFKVMLEAEIKFDTESGKTTLLDSIIEKYHK